MLGAYASGQGTLRELAARFDVSYGWVAKIHAEELATGSRRRVVQRRRQSGVDGDQVRRLIRAKPDIVLRELQQEMLKTGRRVSLAQLWRTVKRLGLVLKKSRSTPLSATPKATSASAKSTSAGLRRSRPRT